MASKHTIVPCTEPIVACTQPSSSVNTHRANNALTQLTHCFPFEWAGGRKEAHLGAGRFTVHRKSGASAAHTHTHAVLLSLMARKVPKIGPRRPDRKREREREREREHAHRSLSAPWGHDADVGIDADDGPAFGVGLDGPLCCDVAKRPGYRCHPSVMSKNSKLHCSS